MLIRLRIWAYLIIAVSVAIVAYWVFMPGSLGEKRSFRQAGWVYDLSFIPGTNYFISTEIYGGETRLWDRRWTASLMSICPDGMTVDASTDGKLVAIGTIHGEVILWNPGDRKELSRWQAADSSISCVRFSPDASIIAVANGPRWSDEDHEFGVTKSSNLDLVNTTDGGIKYRLDGMTGYITNVEFDQTGSRLFYATSLGAVGCWSIKDKKYLWSIGARGFVGSAFEVDQRPLSLAPNNRTLVFGLILINANTGHIEKSLSIQEISKCTSSRFRDDEHVLIGSGDIFLVDVRSKKVLWKCRPSKNGGNVIALDINRDRQEMLTGTEGSIGGFDALSAGVPVSDPYIRLWALPK